MNKYLTGLAAICIIAPGIGCSRSGERQPALRNVVIVSSRPVGDSTSTLYPGVIEESANINASFMADGKIGQINVREGDRVHKGQLLALLDDADYQIGLSQLNAQFDQMTKEKERMDAMFERHNIAPNDYEKFVAGYEQLRLQLEMMKRKIDYTRLYSPSDGYIASKNLNVGELVGAGTPVFNIVDDSHFFANVDLPVSAYRSRANIKSVSGKVPAVEAEIPLNVVSFTPDADNNMLYHLKLSIPSQFSKELSAGMNISVNVLSEQPGAPAGAMVPSRAVFQQDRKTYVWVLNPADSTLLKTPVTVVGAPLGKFSVVEGLGGNEAIVETGVKQLYDGEKVNVVNKKDFGL